MADLVSVTAEIKSTGETIAARKAAKASKEEIAPLVTQLLALKAKYAELNNGVPYDIPKTEEKKKEKKPPPVQETKRDGGYSSSVDHLISLRSNMHVLSFQLAYTTLIII